MDFPAQALEGRPAFFQSLSSSSGVPNAYFAAQAWCAHGYFAAPSLGGIFQAQRAGYFDVAGDIRRAELTGEAVSAREILQRELLKERIRSDIILRELARVRMLEEEARWELETERALAVRRHHKEFVSSFGITPDISEERVLLTHSASEVVEKGMVVASVDTDRSDRGKLFGEGMVEKSCPTKIPPIDHEKNSAVSAFSPTAKPLTAGLGGVKRKASELPGITRKKTGGLAERDWSCALCQVNTTSRVALNEHLQGRKHKINAELMGIIEHTGDFTSAKGADSPLPVAEGMALEESKTKPNVKGKHPLMKAKAQYQSQKQQKTARLHCKLCDVECNSNSALADHLGGKKHRTRLEKSRTATTKVADEKEMAVELQGSGARDKAKANSLSTDEGTGVVLKWKRRQNLQFLMME